jgi:arylformamidase
MSNKTNQFVFLGYPLSQEAPTPPAIPAMELTPFMSLKQGNEANVTMIKVISHTGTHVDAPSHVIEEGITITDFTPEEFVFSNPHVIDLPLQDGEIVQPNHLAPFVEANKDADLLLFRFGYGHVRHSDPIRYSTKCPGFGVESAEFLREEFPNMRALGMDVPSLSCIEYLDQTMAAHNILLRGKERRFLVIEDMYLHQDLSRLSVVIVAPLLIERCDGGPCTVLGQLY